MVRALYCVVWCSQGRLENRTNKKTQWQINVPPPHLPRHPTDPLSPLRTVGQKSVQLRTFQYIQKHPIYPFTCYSRTKQKKKKKARTPRGAFISVFLCHRHDLCLLRGAPCSVNAWQDHLCTNTAGPPALPHTLLSSNQGYIL